MTFVLRKGNITIVPVLHYTMECAVAVRQAFLETHPSCVAVELAETMEPHLLHAASRLPDVSVVSTDNLLYLCEPCDAAMEALRSAEEADIPAHCIDLDLANYPDVMEWLPDPYAIKRLGLQAYFDAYLNSKQRPQFDSMHDTMRELHMARRLKELSILHDSVLFVCGMAHAKRVLDLTKRDSFPTFRAVERENIEIATLSEVSCREVMAECGFVTQVYEVGREEERTPDRQKILFQLIKKVGLDPAKKRLLARYVRNWALVTGRLLPDLYQLIIAARSCVDDAFAYELWELATTYPHRRNIDGLDELDLSSEEVWGQARPLHFNLKAKKDTYHFSPPSPYSICSHPPEDIRIERFGEYLREKGGTLLANEKRRSVPLTSSLEDGIDVRETIRNWHTGKLYVKIEGKPPGPTGSVVIIFDEDTEKYGWEATWHGEHPQESDMAFYATPTGQNIVGPGISGCEYGGLLMTYPPRRLHEVWADPDYAECQTKSEVLLMVGIEYAQDPVVVYVARKPPSPYLKKYAARFHKRIAYLPLGQLSSVELNKIRKFHVLEGHHTRGIADDYIT